MKELLQKNIEIKQFWKKVLTQIEFNTSDSIYKQIASSVVPLNKTEETLILGCENSFIQNNIIKYTNEIKQNIFNAHQKNLEIIVKVQKGVKSYETQKESENLISNEVGSLFNQNLNENELLKNKQDKSGLNTKYTFDKYIKGDNNNLAIAIAKTIANKPGEVYNPVFLYGGSGLGKTHLIQAIGNQIIKNQPNKIVLYTTGEQFTNELIESIQGGDKKYASNRFRNKYRKADVFLIDDVQFIIGKTQTQEEFFHTFNTLYMQEKQIVITSDKPPSEFGKLPERITSRFQSGIIVDILPPSFETRSAILRTKRDLSNDKISNEVIDFISEKINSNIRELEGAYLRVVSIANATDQLITIDLASSILKISTQEKTIKQVNMNQILKTVCNHYSVKAQDVKGNRRTKDIVLPRQVTMYLIQNITKTPLMTIGDFLGGRDHTTVLYGTQKIEKDMQNDLLFKKEIEAVKNKIYEE